MGPVDVSLVDPGSGTLRVAIARLEEGQAALLGWGETSADGLLTSDLQLGDAADLAQACGVALAAAEAMATDCARQRVRPTRAVVGLPAVWLWGAEHMHSQTRVEPERLVNRREVEGLLGRARRATEAMALERLGAPGVVVDVALVDLQVDGLRVSDPTGFRGETLTCAVFAAAARRATVRAWRLAGESLGLHAIALAPMAMPLAHCLPDGDSLVLDIGAESTDLLWLSRGNPRRVDSILFGGNGMTRSLQERLGLSATAALYLKHQYAAGYVAGDRRAQVETALIPALQAWYDQLQNRLSAMARGEPLPSSMLLMGQAAQLPEVVEGARALVWSDKVRFARYPQVRVLQPTDVPCAFDRTGRSPGLASISLLALAGWEAARHHHPVTGPGALLAQGSR